MKLWANDGSFSKRAATSYDTAKTEMKEAMKTGRYYQCWIEEKR